MRAIFLLSVFVPVCLSGLGSLFGGGSDASWDSIGPKCQAFLNKLLPKLTSSFSPSDKIVCQIGTDLGKCVANASSISVCTDALKSKSSSYMMTLSTTKLSLINYVTSFTSCLSKIENEVGMIDFLVNTVGKALTLKLKKPMKKKIIPKMKKMKSNNKPEDERVEYACELGTAIATNDLIKNVVKKVMLLTNKETWDKCVMGEIVSNGLLTIGKFVKSSFKLKKSAPSG